MNKRIAVGQASGASPPKRRMLDNDYAPSDVDEGEDDVTTAQTASSIGDAGSPATAATTPRAKFPSDLKTLACPWPDCPKTFNRPARLRDHMNSHTNSRPFKCPYDDCDKDYIEDKHLKQHIKGVHTNERKHVCQREGCGKSFTTGTRLKRHQAVHEGADRFRCQDCGQSFRKKETLNKHLRKEHQGLRAHPCSEPGCDAAFDSKPNLKKHQEREHGDLKYWCGECGLKNLPDGTERRVGFTTEVLLQAHLKTEHQNCMFCDYTSTTRWELDKHMETKHSGKTVDDRKTHPCPVDGCAKKFTSKSNMTTHLRTAHQGQRFVCGESPMAGPMLQGWSDEQGCGDKFVTKMRLEDHIRFVHLGHERPKHSKSEKPRSFDDIIDDISGVADQAKHSVHCAHCEQVFIRYADLDTHVASAHDKDAVGAAENALVADSFLESALPDPSQDFADTDFGAAALDWPGDEDIFAAHYDPPQDEWPEDEANILLLARDTPELDAMIDPALDHF